MLAFQVLPRTNFCALLFFHTLYWYGCSGHVRYEKYRRQYSNVGFDQVCSKSHRSSGRPLQTETDFQGSSVRSRRRKKIGSRSKSPSFARKYIFDDFSWAYFLVLPKISQTLEPAVNLTVLETCSVYCGSENTILCTNALIVNPFDRVFTFPF